MDLDVMPDNCPHCKAEPTGIGAPSGFHTWSCGSYRRAETGQFRQSDACRIAELEAENKRLRAENTLLRHQADCHWCEIGGCQCDECDRLAVELKLASEFPDPA